MDQLSMVAKPCLLEILKNMDIIKHYWKSKHHCTIQFSEGSQIPPSAGMFTRIYLTMQHIPWGSFMHM